MPEWNNDSIRMLERSSIRAFMEKHQQYLKGRVLDFGAGKQPYCGLVQGEYIAYDVGLDCPSSAEKFDCVMCNQVVQYLLQPGAVLFQFHDWLASNKGHLVMTYATCWDEIEQTDLFRFTKAGMEYLLKMTGFTVIAHERRAEINLNGFKFPLGYGVVAQAS